MPYFVILFPTKVAKIPFGLMLRTCSAFFNSNKICFVLFFTNFVESTVMKALLVHTK